MTAADQERLEHTMKKMIALLLAALLVFACAPVALAAPANPFADSTIHVMEIESFDSGYPSGDISQWPGFWSYNVEVQHAAVVGIVDKNGRLAISGCGQDSFLFARAKGAISSSVLQQADGIGFYVNNDTRNTIEVAPYGTGSKSNKDNGAAMFFFNKGDATFVKTDGTVMTITAKDGQFTIPAMTEGYLMTDFKDFIDGWHNTPLDTGKTDLALLGFRMNATVNVRRMVYFDHYFLYGKNLKHVPGTITMKLTPSVTTTAATKAPTTQATKAPATQATQAPNTTANATEPSETVTEPDATATTPADAPVAPSESEAPTTAAPTETKAADANKSGGMKPVTLVLILVIIVVAAVGSIVVISMVKKSKGSEK